jgi:hypothetical protein
MGAGPWYAPLARGHIFSTSCEYFISKLLSVMRELQNSTTTIIPKILKNSIEKPQKDKNLTII